MQIAILKFTARFSSFILHPIFLLVLNLFLLLSIKPYWFGVKNWSEKSLLIILVGIYTILIPGISIVMLKFLNLIKSFQMRDKYDRIIPLIICMIFYLWLWVNLKRDLSIPDLWIVFLLSTVIATGLSIAINNWITLSLHMIGMTITTVFWIIIRMNYCENYDCNFKFTSAGLNNFNLDYLIMILILLSGWTASVRLYLKAHKIKEIITGIAIGAFSILLAYKIN
ncbi:MAG: hypothetical protein ABI851_00945 [Saprospiraceae bacterium]